MHFIQYGNISPSYFVHENDLRFLTPASVSASPVFGDSVLGLRDDFNLTNVYVVTVIYTRVLFAQ